ncbi:MAG: carbohydrate ABC transporter permease [Clostridia bacterium]|nr:carbohydrate ABC transporter permease [Clostridia bacterium]
MRYAYIDRKDRVRSDLRGVLLYAFLIFWALISLVPLIWVLINSFKSSNEILLNSLGLPQQITFTNYVTMATYPDMNLLTAFRNSMIICGGVVSGVLIGAGFAAFALGRFDNVFNRYVNALLAGCMLVPAFSTLIPNFVLISASPLRGTWLAVIFPLIASNMSFSTLLLSGYVRSLPKELDEAAIIDGANTMQVFWKIIVPLTKPMFATVGVMTFIWTYNELLLSLVYLPTRNLQPISVILSLVSNMFGTDYGAMMAAICLTILPVLILYVLAQEQVVKGLTAGSVKG